MKALSLWQPWASLVALGVKTIETRSWSTKYRGPLAIHAAKREPKDMSRVGSWTAAKLCAGLDPARDETWWELWPDDAPAGSGIRMPLGAVIATCELVDVVPIVGLGDLPDGPFVYCDGDWLQVHDGPEDSAPRYSETEQHYGDYRPGRYAWLLNNLRPTRARCPGCGGVDCDGGPAATYPARGRQGLWEWTP